MKSARFSDPGIHSGDLDDLYENAPCGYVALLPDGKIAKVNPTLCSWLGIPGRCMYMALKKFDSFGVRLRSLPKGV